MYGFYIAGVAILLIGLKLALEENKERRYQRRYHAKFKDLQESYETARRFVQEHGELSFGELPNFAFKTPYVEGIEKDQGTVRFKKDKDLDDLMNDFYRLFYTDMSELIYLRGDKHSAGGSDTRVLLIIKEVEQSKRELAIVAVVLTSYGHEKEFSVRYSCFPRTIHRDVPRINVKLWDFGSEWDNYYYRYFAQPSWVKNGQVTHNGVSWCVPSFAEETENAAKRIAHSVHEKLCREYDPKY